MEDEMELFGGLWKVVGHVFVVFYEVEGLLKLGEGWLVVKMDGTIESFGGAWRSVVVILDAMMSLNVHK